MPLYFYNSVNPWSRSCLDGLVSCGSPIVVGVAKQKKKKMAADKLRGWSYFYIKDLFLLRFSKCYREIDTVKNPVIVTEKYV